MSNDFLPVGLQQPWLNNTQTPQEMAETFLGHFRDSLVKDGTAIDSALHGQVERRFAAQVQTVLRGLEAEAGGAVRCLAYCAPVEDTFENPEQEVEYEPHMAALQEIVQALSAQLGPVVMTFFTLHGQSFGLGQMIFAVNADGEFSGWLPEDQTDRHWTGLELNIARNPQPAVELATRYGLAWLELGEYPDRAMFANVPKLHHGAISEPLRTAEPGGTDMLAASSAFALGGMGALWFLRRRARLMGQAEVTPVSARSLLQRAAQVALILLGAAVLGGLVSILIIQFEPLVFRTAEGQQVHIGPTLWGYPLGNWLRGAAIGGGLTVAVVLAVAAGRRAKIRSRQVQIPSNRHSP